MSRRNFHQRDFPDLGGSLRFRLRGFCLFVCLFFFFGGKYHETEQYANIVGADVSQSINKSTHSTTIKKI